MRIITRGAKVGPCNICGNVGPLTEDHIPPKGVSRVTQVLMLNIVDFLQIQRPKKSGRISQNGVKYRTICSQCNNELLGLNYDPTLITLTKNVRTHLESFLLLPTSMSLMIKPTRLVRSIVGHLLAHGVNEHRNGKMVANLTDYFLDESAPFPEGLNIYYWVYPYNDQVIVKGATLSLYYMNSFAVFMLLKFFPLSFLFVLDKPSEWKIPFYRLDSLLTQSIDDEAVMHINFKNLPPQRWPEAPTDTGMVMHGAGSTGAIPKTF